jgi:hypothetical protein
LTIDFKKELDIMRWNFNKGNRKIGKLPKPPWTNSKETLSKIYSEYLILAQTGEIHYAHLVQANVILFKFFPHLNCPANIIVSLNDYYAERPHDLKYTANVLFGYKNTENAPEELKVITDSITDEYDRLYNVKLPNEPDMRSDIFFTTIMVYRKHLPGRKLSGSLFPVLTDPKNLQSTLILPKKYWTKSIINNFK